MQCKSQKKNCYLMSGMWARGGIGEPVAFSVILPEKSKEMVRKLPL